MTQDSFPITPPLELVQKWHRDALKSDPIKTVAQYLATYAARWGADQELEACCEVLENDLSCFVASDLRAARRPKPPSLKEQALAVLEDASNRLDAAHENIIRRALESLPD